LQLALVVTQIIPIFSIKEIMTQKESLVKIEGVKDITFLPAKMHAVKMNEGKTYTMTMASTEVEAFLVLQNNTGKQLAYHHGGGSGRSAFLGWA
jgi:hypothetical protein